MTFHVDSTCKWQGREKTKKASARKAVLHVYLSSVHRGRLTWRRGVPAQQK
jgi:hypothetical protein